MRLTFTGVGTALITPFTRTGALDEAAVRRLARRQVDAGVHFLVPHGTRKCTPASTCRFASRRTAVSSSAPVLVNGVINAVPTPVNVSRIGNSSLRCEARGATCAVLDQSTPHLAHRTAHYHYLIMS